MARPVEKFADVTGGGYRHLSGSEDLNVAMADVLEELRHQYLIGFTPAVADERAHTIALRAARSGFRVWARTAAQAPKR
jgi:hypothetical protein